jgi:hypothetical protein
VKNIKVEGSLRGECKNYPANSEEVLNMNHYQLLKQGYFVVDPDTTSNHLVLNRTCSLKDNYLK